MKPGKLRLAAWTALTAVLFFSAAAADLGLRSRSALLEARKQELWRDTPRLKELHYNGLFEKKLLLLKENAGRLTPEEMERRESLLKAERDLYISGSSAKLAYTWYKTAAGEFASPLNPWAAEAGKNLEAARDAWRSELAAAGPDAPPGPTD
ncbi:MAG: hypothetical protein COT18_06660 [Elusimicrobia bacterium CG08_land_8_20_14_0_20_59_10]|nr:MAG: hypothetical protein COT18_06660 [Elusimicrobia bacterium CG08_land_8_20_14_0_20_59_10]